MESSADDGTAGGFELGGSSRGSPRGPSFGSGGAIGSPRGTSFAGYGASGLGGRANMPVATGRSDRTSMEFDDGGDLSSILGPRFANFPPLEGPSNKGFKNKYDGRGSAL